jgi:hypothetical protein
MNKLIQEIEEAVLGLIEDEDEDVVLMGLLDDGIIAVWPHWFG